MRYHLFLQYGWFLQNLVKDFIPTNMHTTVVIQKLFGNIQAIVMQLSSRYRIKLCPFSCGSRRPLRKILLNPFLAAKTPEEV